MTEEEKSFFVSFRTNKAILHKSIENNNYLNTKAVIKNVSCFNQVAKIFNLEKTFDSFFNSNVVHVVNNLKFLELEYVLVEKLLLIPRHVITRLHISKRTLSSRVEKVVRKDIKKQVFEAAKGWINHKSKERKKHEKIFLAKVQAALEPVTQPPVHNRVYNLQY